MKDRIKIDTAILSFLIVLTGFLFIFPRLYAVSRNWDQVFDLIGFTAMFEGIYLRMAARGHKKYHSQEGRGLVTSGPYQYMRNPMYLGSFLLGSGFISLLWPWWLIPIFGGLFYLRFQKQIMKEESYLKDQFKEVYESYCQKVPRLFPDLRKLKRANIRKDFIWEELWSTKDKYGLVAWPLFAFLAELFQEKLVFGSWGFLPTVVELFLAVVIFAGQLWFVYPDALKLSPLLSRPLESRSDSED